jgi:hypothetical protein
LKTFYQNQESFFFLVVSVKNVLYFKIQSWIKVEWNVNWYFQVKKRKTNKRSSFFSSSLTPIVNTTWRAFQILQEIGLLEDIITDEEISKKTFLDF